jgi:tetratricopeptide (TPR) repeat protein/DNA-binding CsgD family transcriptional regulator
MNKILFILILIISIGKISFSINERKLDSLQKIVDSESGIKKIKPLFNIINELITIGENKKALPYAIEAYNTSLSSKLPEELNSATEEIRIIYASLDEYYKANEYFKRSIEFYTKGNYDKELVNCYNNYADFYLNIYQYDKALEYANKSLKLCSKINIIIDELYNTFAVIYLRSGDYNKAVHYQKKAIEGFIKNGDSLKIGAHFNEIGIFFIENEEYDSAQKYFYDALHLFKIYKPKSKTSKNYSACILDNLAEVEFKKENLENANSLFEQALKIRKEINYIWGIGNTSTNIGRVLLKQNKYLEAENYLNEGELYALKCIDRSYSNLILKNNYKAKALLYSETKKFEDAYQYLSKYINLNDTLFNKEVLKNIKELQIKYEAEKKELEIENQKIFIDRKKDQLFLSILIGGLIFIIAVVIILHIIKTRKQKEKILKKEKENLIKELELNNRDLVCNVSKIYTKNQIINKVAQTLTKNNIYFKQANVGMINNIISELKHNIDETSWKEFESYFVKVHGSFYKSLDEHFPGLTKNERKICAMLKLGMSSKEIAAITITSYKSVDTTRSRLRKKLGLANSENLFEFLNRL